MVGGSHGIGDLTDLRMGEIFSFMVEHVHDYAIYIMDAEGVILTWNKAAEAMKGYSEQEAIGSFFGMFYTEEDQARRQPQANLRKAARRGVVQDETWRRRKDGSLFWAVIEIIAIRTRQGELSGFCKITRDLTSSKILRNQLAAEKERAQVTLAAIGEAVIAVNADGRVEYMNPKAERLTGWSSTDALGCPLGDVFHVVDESTLLSRTRQLVSALQHGRTLGHGPNDVMTSRNGTRFTIEGVAAPIHHQDGDGSAAGGAIIFRDVSDSRQQFREVAYQATHDALTGLVNRAEFEHCLQRSLYRARHSRTPGALLFMDLDRFKLINDSCGHDAGDTVLKQLSALYRHEVRERDILARLGGDEFALIADHCSKEEAYAIARKILESTQAYQFSRDGKVFQLGVSIGLAMFDHTTSNGQELLKQADSACYAAKQEGRNRIVCDPVLTQASARQCDIDWAQRLTAAMQSNRLTLYQQHFSAPLHAGSAQCEVLLRLIDTDDHIVMPSSFLPAAERYDLMPGIDRWVVESTLKWLDENRRQALPLPLCAVNLSARTLDDDDFPLHLAGLLEHYPVPPENLCFEIAASAAVGNAQKSLQMMTALRQAGCKISLSGVGTGIASPANIRAFPADFIKIDGSLVSALTQGIIEEKILASVNDIAHLMGQQTIAERVENQQTADVLSRLGIDYMQGNWVAPPTQLAPIGTLH
jgi:diguanylate cyclase (GGDEF)-like protein/PAS domain S-box-containing protein